MFVKTYSFALVVLFACQAVSADPHRNKSKKIACENTSIKEILSRLENSDPRESGTAIRYSNGGFGIGYDYIPEISERSKVGDPVKLCMVAQETDCPKGSDPRKLYRATNLRTKESWELYDSHHGCGGA